MKEKQQRNFREVFVAIVIGACVSFLTVLFEGLADFLTTYGDQIIAGMSSVAYYLAKQYRV